MTIIRKCLEEIKPMSQERAEAIRQLPDEEIDLSDIPELDETFFKQAKQVRRIEEVSTTPVAKSFST
jgi:DNA primase large subunit